MIVERGSIYRVNLDPTIGSEQQGNARPCVVMSLTAYNKQLRTVSVVPLGSWRALPVSGGSVADLGLVRTRRT